MQCQQSGVGDLLGDQISVGNSGIKSVLGISYVVGTNYVVGIGNQPLWITRLIKMLSGILLPNIYFLHVKKAQRKYTNFWLKILFFDEKGIWKISFIKDFNSAEVNVVPLAGGEESNCCFATNIRSIQSAFVLAFCQITIGSFLCFCTMLSSEEEHVGIGSVFSVKILETSYLEFVTLGLLPDRRYASCLLGFRSRIFLAYRVRLTLGQNCPKFVQKLHFRASVFGTKINFRAAIFGKKTGLGEKILAKM